MDPAIRRYALTSTRQAEAAVSGWAVPRRVAARLVEVLHRLLAAKAQLIGRLEGSGCLAHEVPGGLGAMCITAAEEYVSRFLADSQFGSTIIARQFRAGDLRKGPPIHVYNIFRTRNVDFVIDMDLDPFVGENTGVVLVPADIPLPYYQHGFHSRRMDGRGRIVRYQCSFQAFDGTIRRYMEGDTAEYMTVAPYHGRSGENLCPVCLKGGATVYFGHDSIISIDMPSLTCDAIPLVLVCPAVAGDRRRLHQLTFENVRRFSIRRVADGIRLSVHGPQATGIRLGLAADGTLIPEPPVSAVTSNDAGLATFSARVQLGADAPLDIRLPRPTS